MGSPKLYGRHLMFLAKHPWLPIYRVEGEVQGTLLSMLIADDGSTLSYIREMAFPDGATTRKVGKVNAFSAPDMATSSDADIVVVGANYLLLNNYRERGFHLVPKWVCPVISTPECIGDIRNESLRRNIRRAQSKGFTHEVTTSHSWFHEFYGVAYKPYAVGKFGELAVVERYRTAKRVFSRGAAVVVNLDQDHVIGMVVYPQGETLRMSYVGVYPDKECLVRQGGATVLYYYCALLAHSRGHRTVNMGTSRPFLSDGPLRFKLNWRPSRIVQNDSPSSVFAITAPRETEAARKFFAVHPFYEMVDGELQIYRG